MRRKRAGAAILLCAGVLLASCFDLFHSTKDVLTACDVDAQTPGCSQRTDFCAWTPVEAKQRALHACAWLGACEGPMGGNAFGPCVFQASLAYDCASNPNHRVLSKARDLWDCLQRADSCASVDACVFEGTPAPNCLDSGGAATCSGSTRVACTGEGAAAYPNAHGENCALWGKTCAARDGTTLCAGDPAGIGCDAAEACEPSGQIHFCVAPPDGGPRIDRGIDCAYTGAGYCSVFPRGAPRWIACNAGSDSPDGSDSCDPDVSATCANGRATSCASGRLESVDCATLLGEPGLASACSPGRLDLMFDWTSPCKLGGGECPSDTCNGDALLSCARGAAFSVDCRSEGLKGCNLSTPEPGDVPRAACVPP